MANLTPVEIAALTDEELKRRYLASEEEAGDAQQDALAEELNRRNLDV